VGRSMNAYLYSMTDEDLRIHWRNMMRWEAGGGPRYRDAHVRDSGIMADLVKGYLTGGKNLVDAV